MAFVNYSSCSNYVLERMMDYETDETKSVLDILNEAEEVLFASLEDFEPTPIGPNAIAVEVGDEPITTSIDYPSKRFRSDSFVKQLPPFFFLQDNHQDTFSSSSSSPANPDCQQAPQQKKRRLSVPDEDLAPIELSSSSGDDLFFLMSPALVVGGHQHHGTTSTNSSVSAPFRHYQAEQWNDRFQDLLTYRRTSGHCSVPHDFPTNQGLSQWVKRQRYQYRLKQTGRHSTLTDARQVELEDVGFVWDSHQASWDERFESLKEFQNFNGHCSVSSQYEDKTLAVWIKCQRRNWKLLKNGKKSALNGARICRLDSIGFEWNPRNL
jgi:hypothetical protein